MISISAKLKKRFAEVRDYLDLLEDPMGLEDRFPGISAVRDNRNRIIPGALRYGDENIKNSVTILGGIHMNELSGLYALLRFHRDWLAGSRPKNMTVLTAIGHPERTREFIDAVLSTDRMSPTAWSDFRRTKDLYNFNRISWDILTKKELAGNDEQRAHDIIKHVIAPSRGRVLDLHNTSTEAPPIVTLFMEEGDTPQQSVDRLKATGVTNNLPIRDFIIWKPGPYNGMESIRSFGEYDSDAQPILIESGTGFDPDSFERAYQYARIWLNNVANLDLEEPATDSESLQHVTHAHYVETGALYHPHVRPLDFRYMDSKAFKEAEKDTLVLIRDRPSLNAITGWSEKARLALEKLNDQNLAKDRLDNFKPISKGDIIAIGLKTGLEIRSPQDGHVLMVGSDPCITPAFNESIANFSIMLR